MAEKKVQLSKKDRLSVALRSTFLQGSWNYERMQNGGWCFAMMMLFIGAEINHYFISQSSKKPVKPRNKRPDIPYELK